MMKLFPDTDFDEMDPKKYDYDYEIFFWIMNFVEYMMHQGIPRDYVSLKAQ